MENINTVLQYSNVIASVKQNSGSNLAWESMAWSVKGKLAIIDGIP